MLSHLHAYLLYRLVFLLCWVGAPLVDVSSSGRRFARVCVSRVSYRHLDYGPGCVRWTAKQVGPRRQRAVEFQSQALASASWHSSVCLHHVCFQRNMGHWFVSMGARRQCRLPVSIFGNGVGWIARHLGRMRRVSFYSCGLTLCSVGLAPLAARRNVKGRRVQSSEAVTFRRSIMYWSIGPVVATALTLLLVEVTGRAIGPNAQGFIASLGWGVGLLPLAVPVVCAHITAIAVVIGFAGIFLGLRTGLSLGAVLFVATAFAGFVLLKMYAGF